MPPERLPWTRISEELKYYYYVLSSVMAHCTMPPWIPMPFDGLLWLPHHAKTVQQSWSLVICLLLSEFCLWMSRTGLSPEVWFLKPGDILKVPSGFLWPLWSKNYSRCRLNTSLQQPYVFRSLGPASNTIVPWQFRCSGNDTSLMYSNIPTNINVKRETCPSLYHVETEKRSLKLSCIPLGLKH